MEESLQLEMNYDSSDECPSTTVEEQSHADSNCEAIAADIESVMGLRPVKTGVHTMIDKKIFSKFNKLTKTLKETRSNLLTVDHMLGKYKGDVRSHKSETLFDESGQPRVRRASSLPPPFVRATEDNRLSGGDNAAHINPAQQNSSLHQHRSQSVGNFEAVGIFGGDGNVGGDDNMPALRMPMMSPKTETIPPSTPGKRTDFDEKDNFESSLHSMKGSDVSVYELSSKIQEHSYSQSAAPSAPVIEELRVEIMSLKSQLNNLQASGQFHGQSMMLCQQLESRDKQINDMNRQMHEFSSKLDASEDQRRQLVSRLEETLRTSVDVGSEADRLASEAKRMEQMASDLQADKDRLRRRARKVVQELKNKCKKHAAEAQRLREHEWEMEQRSSQSAQEKNFLATQLTAVKDKVTSLQTELEVSNENKRQSELQVQQKDKEISDLRSANQETHQNLQQFKDLYAKLVEENETLKTKMENLSLGKTRIESTLAVSEKEVDICREHVDEFRKELKDLRMTNGELMAQSMTEAALRKTAEHNADIATGKLQNLEKQLEDIQSKYLVAVNEHSKVTETLRNELVSQKNSEEQKYQEILKAKQMQYESRFTSFKLDLAENQATLHSLQEALTKDQEAKTQLKNEVQQIKDEYGSLEAKYRRVLRHYHSKKKRNQDKEKKIQLLQDSLVEVQEMGNSLEEDFKDILRLIYIDIGDTCNMLSNAKDCPEACDVQKLRGIPTRDMLTGIKNKLRWLQDELRHESTLRSHSPPRLPPHHTVSLDSVHASTAAGKLSTPNSARSNPSCVPLLPRSPMSNVDRTVGATDLVVEKIQSMPSLLSLDKPKSSHSEPSVSRKDSFWDSSLPPQRVPSFPFNSTSVKEADKSSSLMVDADQVEILKRYQRFQQIFQEVNAELTASKSRLERHERSTQHGHVSTGMLSVTSSLSSISEFSTDTVAAAAAPPELTNSTLLDDTSSIPSTIKEVAVA